MAKIPRVPVENQITTLSVVKIAIKFSPCIIFYCPMIFFLSEIMIEMLHGSCFVSWLENSWGLLIWNAKRKIINVHRIWENIFLSSVGRNWHWVKKITNEVLNPTVATSPWHTLRSTIHFSANAVGYKKKHFITRPIIILIKWKTWLKAMISWIR